MAFQKADRFQSFSFQIRNANKPHGPELTSRHLLAWCVERDIELLPAGKPTQNADVESLHGRRCHADFSPLHPVAYILYREI